MKSKFEDSYQQRSTAKAVKREEVDEPGVHVEHDLDLDAPLAFDPANLKTSQNVFSAYPTPPKSQKEGPIGKNASNGQSPVRTKGQGQTGRRPEEDTTRNHQDTCRNAPLQRGSGLNIASPVMPSFNAKGNESDDPFNSALAGDTGSDWYYTRLLYSDMQPNEFFDLPCTGHTNTLFYPADSGALPH